MLIGSPFLYLVCSVRNVTRLGEGVEGPLYTVFSG